jgi:hypothetical protein
VTESNVGDYHTSFEFRQTIEGDSVRQSRGGNLYALGEHVAVYVDEETPIDWDSDCSDPNNPIEASDLPAFGFDNCDLDEVVNTIDDNIWPTLTGLFGMPSDVDNNCRVTIFLSHRLNRLTQTNADESDDGLLVKSFAEPEIDLWAADQTLNPGSNAEEIIFLYAPDPVGFYGQPVPLENYLNYEVAGQVSVALQDLISYANHREAEKALLDPANPEDIDNPPAEEDWLNDALGLLAADLTGFGAISYPDAWLYMDRSHLLELQVASTLEDFRDRGGQYLFARYLHDLYGDGMIATLINAETQGIDSIMEVAQDFASFDDLVLTWATAMAVSGREHPSGGQLVVDEVIPNFSEAGVVVVADPENPQPGELYGANGFQTGFRIRGENRVFTDGAVTGGPVEITDALVKTGNLDHQVFHPQTDFFGSVAGNYGVVAVLVGGLEQPINYLKIETTGGTDLLMNVIRIDDSNPDAPSVTLEDVDGAKMTTVRQLGELDASGTDLHVIGRIDAEENIDLSGTQEPPVGDDDDSAGPPPPLPFGAGDDDDSAGDDDDDDDDEASDIAITDTDRYSFTLSSEQVVGIWLDRRLSSIAGEVDLNDPFFALALSTDIPDSFDYSMWGFGPLPSHGPCPDPSLFNYPLIMPGWLAAQGNLMSVPTEGVLPVGVNWTDLVAAPTSYACAYDHDQDGILDVDEFEPDNLMTQILLRQAENLWTDSDFYLGYELLGGSLAVDEPWWSRDLMDIDTAEDSDDSFATEIMSLNIGGRSAADGKEAVGYWMLPAGEYTLIVAGSDSAASGPYDLTFRVLSN